MSTFIRLVDANGEPISAQAAYDAAMSGPVYLNITDQILNTSSSISDSGIAVQEAIAKNETVYEPLFLYDTIMSNDALVSVIFMNILSNGIYYYAGENQNGGKVQ